MENQVRKLTNEEWSAVSFMLGVAMGAMAKLEIKMEETSKMAIDKLMVQAGGYSYYHPRETVLSSLKEENP